MKKELPALTDEEKINFCVKLKTTNIDHRIKGNLNFSKIILLAGIASIIVCAATLAISGMQIITSLGPPILSATIICPLFELLILPQLIPNLNDFKRASNKKITYRQYRKLLKSGEIAKWEAQFNEQITERVNELKGIEIAEYKKDAERQIINEVYNNLPNKEGLKLDADKIAEEVRRMVNENNKNNSSEQQK